MKRWWSIRYIVLVVVAVLLEGSFRAGLWDFGDWGSLMLIWRLRGLQYLGILALFFVGYDVYMCLQKKVRE